MSGKTKRKPAYYNVDFVTALSIAACRQRLESGAANPIRNMLAPMTQRIEVMGNDQFWIERSFPGAIQPIRLSGILDLEPEGGKGTWVHGAITHDTENQVLIEGLIVFVTFFVLTALFFLRLKARALVISVPLLLLALLILSVRWRALRVATEDMARWLRRRLYLTPQQVRGSQDQTRWDDEDRDQRGFSRGAG